MAQLMTELTSPQPGQETRSAVERIAAFAAAALPEHLAPDIRQLFKRNILDSIGCAIAALPGPPFRALRLPPSASNNPPESKVDTFVRQDFLTRVAPLSLRGVLGLRILI